SALAAHPAVRESVVLARGQGAERRLVAWVVADGGVGAAALRAHLSERLPEYMVPAAWAFLDAFPLTRNGKVDRHALREPAEAGGADRARALETPTQELLAEVWREVLGVERVGPADAFFELGGHSLVAMRMVSRVRAVFAVELPLREVFEAPSLRAQAARIDALRAGAAAVSAPPVAPGPRDAPPLSYGQERLWLMETLTPGATAYAITFSLAFEPGAEAEVLKRALEEVVRRHEAVRTVFRVGEQGPVQVVLPPFAVEVPEEELRALPVEEQDRVARDAATPGAAGAFDLERGPLLRARLLRRTGESTLLVTMHHLVVDGWSVRVLERELRALHAAFSRGEPSPLPPLPVQYADYAVWQRRWLETGVLDAQVEFWRRTLAGAPEALDLPGDRPRPAARTGEGARRFFHLPADLVGRARALAQREGATLFMVLLAAFDALLARLAGVDDLVVGTQMAGRTREETEGLIGLFVNGLALRADLSGDPTFREAVARVRRATLDAYAHADVPFQRLVEALEVERTLSHPPVFNVSFLLQTDGSAPVADPLPAPAGGRALADEPEPCPAEYELLFELFEAGGGLDGAVVYSRELFEHETAARFVAEYRRLLEALLDAPDAPLSAPAPADAAEAARVLSFAAGPPANDASLPIHRVFERWAARAPDAVAIRADEGPVAYGELNARANRLAHHLRAAGVGPGSRVGVTLDRSAELVTALLAILKAGGAYVPLDPAYPADRLRLLAAEAGVDAVVTVDPAPVAAWAGGARVVCLRREAAAIAARPAADLEVEADPEALAYVLYTSGSTGLPKGVAVPHRAVVGLAGPQPYARLGADDVFLHLGPPAFDATTLEVWCALLNGGAAAIPPPGVPDPERLGGFVRRHGVTTAWLTAGLFHQVVDAGAAGFEGLRLLMSGGDVLSPAHVARAGELLPGVRLMNGYGPTEATVFTCCHVIRPGEAEAGPLPVGRPVAGARVYVLDAALRPVPAGVPGELYVGGGGLARGYAGRPALTAGTFVPDPFSGIPGARLYRTGDRARWRAETTSAEVRECGSALDPRESERTSALPHSRTAVLEFQGRTDHQVKVRGYRIEPGEIEARLVEHPGVREAVVLAREDTPGDRRLVAYVVGEETAGAEALRAHLGKTLPAYMVPAAYVRLEQLPLTPNGKLDRRALPAPEGDARAAREYEAPVGKVEQALAGIWAELLGVEQVGRWDDFFMLGGHSLLAVQMISRVRQAMEVELALAAVFE
ncbi:MAG: amino acid adenylation domain-containing protein, partial [Longimicrobiaceae bacterium]